MLEVLIKTPQSNCETASIDAHSITAIALNPKMSFREVETQALNYKNVRQANQQFL
jgi:hypothetical protein